MTRYTIPFAELGRHDVATVGGKNSSLGEMIAKLAALHVSVPGGFATTADAYREFLSHEGLAERIRAELATLDVDDVATLAVTGARIRDWILSTPFPARLEQEIVAGYEAMCDGKGDLAVAVRSSATAEDLPEASFAGQQETLLNVRGREHVVRAVHEVFASLFNDRAISYRVHQGGYIYNFDTGALTQITDEDFPGASTVAYLDGYFVFSEPNSQRIWVTTLFDGSSVDPLDFASAEGAPDDVVGLVANHREVWVFGNNSTEVWYNSGDVDFPLSRIQGAYNEVGCVAPNSIAKLDNSIAWLGQDARGRGIVYRANGYQAQRISTHAVEYAIQSYTDMTDAVAYSYQQDGHEFYVLNFPLADTTWTYDAATGAWHERRGLNNGVYTRHRSNCFVNFNGLLVVGDFENGNLYELDLDTYADNGEVQKWLRRWRALPTGQNDFKRTAQHALQLVCETGVGIEGLVFNGDLLVEVGVALMVSDGVPLALGATITPDADADPQVMLRWSDDGGHTWSNEHWRSMGEIGRTQTRVIWRRLGMTNKLRDRVYEVSGSAAVKVAIMGAELTVSGTNG